MPTSGEHMIEEKIPILEIDEFENLRNNSKKRHRRHHTRAGYKHSYENTASPLSGRNVHIKTGFMKGAKKTSPFSKSNPHVGFDHGNTTIQHSNHGHHQNFNNIIGHTLNNA